MKKGKKSSSGDNSFEHPYMIPERWIEIATERLKSALLGPVYRELLNKQIQDCLVEIQKKRKIDLLPK